MGWMGMGVPVDAMPGMASADQLAELGEADGREADVRFLELMADHHRGGVHMADFAASHADDGDVQALAARIARAQGYEINELVAASERLGLDADIERYVDHSAGN